MARILVISIVLTLVYSWEEMKRFVRVLVFRILKRLPHSALHRGGQVSRSGRGIKSEGMDAKVGILVILATVPIGLVYMIAQADNIFAKLIWIGGILIGLAAVAITSEVLLRRAGYATPLVGIVSLFAPMFAVVAETAYLPRKVLAKFAFLLALPPLLGLAFHYVNYGSSVSPELLPHLDTLTAVLVGSLFLRIAIEFLEHYFYLYNLEKLFSYYRVVLGIVLAIILLEG